MKTGSCRCGNRIFFNNNFCLACNATLGRCMQCNALASFRDEGDRLACDSCNAIVFACLNQVHGVCHSYNEAPDCLCRMCEFTAVVPPLDQPESMRRWAVAESAKRRLLRQLEELGLPPFVDDLKSTHPLKFEFKEDTTDAAGQLLKVTTGHQNGVITINLAEADSVHRERMRVQFQEPQRTLIGHMRHEYGHYLDWSWASRVASHEYHQMFGDPEAVDYTEAMQRHYEHGPPSDWANQHVSAYAAMHPWEDFAETVNAYLDVMAIAVTANDLGRRGLDLSAEADASELVNRVLDIVIEVSEYNFDLGLLPLLPERLSNAVLEKFAFVHSLRHRKQVEQVDGVTVG